MGQIEQQVVKHSGTDRMDDAPEENWVAAISPIDGSGRASTGKKFTDTINSLKQFLNLLGLLHRDMSPLSLIVVVGKVALIGGYWKKYDRDTLKGGRLTGDNGVRTEERNKGRLPPTRSMEYNKCRG
ncbi:hypothetical protein GJ744_006502 [Endocarpon pusillum]|uniref:Protein kinase domain-containing protein n=1 Tax=Endocarpon pusillum TaxID=364733 RepID=A0A8H7ARH1_9EURO|nr:hypothetical protein GJ744_006502 [Endocarpon pusillum]